MSAHIDPARAAALALLADDDAEMIAALAHVNDCASCARLLSDARAVIRVLDALPAPVPPAPSLMARVQANVLADLAATPPQRSPSARPWYSPASIALVVLSVAFAIWAGTPGAIQISLGIRCLLTELAIAAVVCIAAYWIWHRKAAPIRPLNFAALAAAGALAGQVGMHFHCTFHDSLPHVLTFHSGGVVVAWALAWVVSRRFTSN